MSIVELVALTSVAKAVPRAPLWAPVPPVIATGQAVILAYESGVVTPGRSG
jgi:hypothetical protein